MSTIGVDAKQELAVAERAIKERWPIPEKLRGALIGTMGTIMLQSDNPRIQTRAAAVIVACDRVNVAAQANDKPSGDVNVNVSVSTVNAHANATEEELDRYINAEIERRHREEAGVGGRNGQASKATLLPSPPEP